MYPIIFSFWKVTIYSHGILVALGLIIGGWLIYSLAKEEDLSTRQLLDLLLYAVIAGLIGARLNYIIVYHAYFNNLWEYLAIWQGGMVSYGGILAGFGVASWYLVKKKENIWKWLDIGIVGFLMGWLIGRCGCFLAGDVIGKPTEFALGIVQPAIDSLPRHPVALYEALAVLIIFFGIIFIYKTRAIKDGLLFFSGMILYFIARFGIEFAREYGIIFWGLSLSQITLIILIIVAVIGLIYRYKYSK